MTLCGSVKAALHEAPAMESWWQEREGSYWMRNPTSSGEERTRPEPCFLRPKVKGICPDGPKLFVQKGDKLLTLCDPSPTAKLGDTEKQEQEKSAMTPSSLKRLDWYRPSSISFGLNKPIVHAPGQFSSGQKCPERENLDFPIT